MTALLCSDADSAERICIYLFKFNLYNYVTHSMFQIPTTVDPVYAYNALQRTFANWRYV